MKAFPRSNKYTLCLLGLILAIEMGWRFSLGDPCGAPPCNASSRAALATSSDRPWHRAVPGSLCAQSCRCVPQGTHTYSNVRTPQHTQRTCTPHVHGLFFKRVLRKQQEPCRCSKPRSHLPTMSVWMCCMRAASSTYLHICTSMCVCTCEYAVPACCPCWIVGIGIALKADVFGLG